MSSVVSDAFKGKFLESWSLLSTIRKPIIAAVSGYAVRPTLFLHTHPPFPQHRRAPLLYLHSATLPLLRASWQHACSLTRRPQLGGGCELALMCDIILASPTAVFGQPEINIGVIPGGGGTQRLAHAIGKSRTMELTLTGRNWTAKEASDWGMVSRVVGEGEGEVVKEAVDLARVIASKSAIAVQANKEAVNAAFEHTLAEGLKYERRIFHSMFATKDQKEGECRIV